MLNIKILDCGYFVITSGIHQNPLSTRIIRQSHASDSIAPPAYACPNLHYYYHSLYLLYFTHIDTINDSNSGER